MVALPHIALKHMLNSFVPRFSTRSTIAECTDVTERAERAVHARVAKNSERRGQLEKEINKLEAAMEGQSRKVDELHMQASGAEGC